ncbi:hypothetical protein B0H11DRAFT_1946411 [Mycena galericulata]|nr:hypothetical protein B0H11DRAFT_1946411 [Mycena galericulata]
MPRTRRTPPSPSASPPSFMTVSGGDSAYTYASQFGAVEYFPVACGAADQEGVTACHELWAGSSPAAGGRERGPESEGEGYGLAVPILGYGGIARASHAGNGTARPFFITTAPTSHFDRKHVVLARSSAAGASYAYPTASGDVPMVPVVISDCGILAPDDLCLTADAVAAATGARVTLWTTGCMLSAEPGVKSRGVSKRNTVACPICLRAPCTFLNFPDANHGDRSPASRVLIRSSRPECRM